ncbi:RNA polymerase sigma factor [Planctomycetaceae bacterium SH139]
MLVSTAPNDADLATAGELACAADDAVTLDDLPQLLDRYGSRVQRFCYSMIGNQDDALDLAQDVFVIAIERRRSFRGGSSVETWLLGIAVRICRNWIRRQAIRHRVLGLFGRSQSSTLADPTEKAARSDEIERGLGLLDVRSREVLVLRYFEGREVEELAEILQLTRSAVDQRLSRARRKLADWLSEQE